MQPTADTRPPTRFPAGTPGATMPPTETDTWRPAEQFKRQPRFSSRHQGIHATAQRAARTMLASASSELGRRRDTCSGFPRTGDRAPSAPSARRFWTTGVASLETKPRSDSSSPVRHLYGPAGSLPAGPRPCSCMQERGEDQVFQLRPNITHRSTPRSLLRAGRSLAFP